MPWDVEWDWRAFFTVAALVQPGLLLLIGWAYRKYWVKGEIVIHPTSSIQVTYGPYGAAIVLTGSLQAVNREQFVAGMALTITNEKTSERHQFGWHAFIVGHQRMTGSGPDSYFEIPAGFMVTPQQGHRYTVDFVDNDLEEEHIQPAIRRVEKEWSKGLTELRKWAMKAMDDPTQRELVPAMYNAEASKLFDAFQEEPLYAEVTKILERNCYWRAGWYRLS